HTARQVAAPDQEIVFVGRDDEDGERAARLAASVGISRIGGHLAGGMSTWREEKRPTSRMQRIDASALREHIHEVQVLDVRERSEWEEGHIPGSVHVPYHDIRGVPEGIDPS
ncbi:rhodanese-like domain-containing protein, partial [Brachyspira hyodysenteriae]|uniref:rhodanese-like domain-containing protein n=1 Tax=Brachyspira hyodysenteriae TaxID=159 RepID=UPI001F5343A4